MNFESYLGWLVFLPTSYSSTPLWPESFREDPVTRFQLASKTAEQPGGNIFSISLISTATWRWATYQRNLNNKLSLLTGSSLGKVFYFCILTSFFLSAALEAWWSTYLQKWKFTIQIALHRSSVITLVQFFPKICCFKRNVQSVYPTISRSPDLFKN